MLAASTDLPRRLCSWFAAAVQATWSHVRRGQQPVLVLVLALARVLARVLVRVLELRVPLTFVSEMVTEKVAALVSTTVDGMVLLVLRRRRAALSSSCFSSSSAAAASCLGRCWLSLTQVRLRTLAPPIGRTTPVAADLHDDLGKHFRGREPVPACERAGRNESNRT